MIPHIINDKKNFISGWYIDKNLCESIVDSCSGKNRLKFDGSQKDSLRGYLKTPLTTLSTVLQKEYELELNKVFDSYREEYPFLLKTEKLELELLHPINDTAKTVRIQMYDPGYSYSVLHCENSGIPEYINRCLVFMTYLNDVNDGGGTSFPYQDTITKAEQGLTLVWPAYWTHPHKGIVSATEKKVIATGWYTFKN